MSNPHGEVAGAGPYSFRAVGAGDAGSCQGGYDEAPGALPAAT